MVGGASFVPSSWGGGEVGSRVDGAWTVCD